MRREGSPLRGVGTVALKEAADHMSSARLHVIMGLVLLVAGGFAFGAITQIRATIASDQFLFLKLFTSQIAITDEQALPSFVGILGFLLPLVAIALGFDAINGEYNRRTMSRLLAQPIYRDAVLFGKFIGGLIVLAIALLTLWLLTVGLGIWFLGQPPSATDVVRALAYLGAALAYAGVWLALAITFSTLIRSAATSALAALAMWLVMSVFWRIVTPVIAQVIAPVDPTDPMTRLTRLDVTLAIERVSPQTLYAEITALLLDPSVRSAGYILPWKEHGAIAGSLPTAESLFLVWPQIAGLIAAMLILFTIAYVSFQRQEVRA